MLHKAAIAGLFVTIVAVFVSLGIHTRSGQTSAIENQSASGRVEAELLVLRSDGFKPHEITRQPGQFLLAVHNHSNQEELSLILKQETGPSLREVRIPKRQSKFKEFLNLPPGRYMLIETNHPEWTCTINIAPY